MSCSVLSATVVSGSVAHPFPEYTEREHVFALSTAFGDAFLMQVRSYVQERASFCRSIALFLFRKGFNDDAPKLSEVKVAHTR